jgi:hypothetical protein
MYLNVRISPAPLDLCYVSGFDLKNDTSACPPERRVLNEFFVLGEYKVCAVSTT